MHGTLEHLRCVNETLPRPSRAAAEEAVRTLICWAGETPGREGLADTPARVVQRQAQLLKRGEVPVEGGRDDADLLGHLTQ